MSNIIIKDLRQNLINFLRTIDNKRNLFQLTKNNCSEISRYIWIDMIEKYWEHIKPFILKGSVPVINETITHDLLWFYWNGKIIIVDPTIWQFYPNKHSIFILQSEWDLDVVINLLKIKYWFNNWKLSEYLDISMAKEKLEWKRMIKNNIEEQFPLIKKI